MIHAKELRIGNLVLNNGQVEKIQLGSDIDHSEWREPIELTSDWMYNFGFERFHDNPRLESFWHSTTGYYPIIINQTRDLQFYYMENTHLKYVHQLQNLIYAITGEELTLKST